jgi:hypothetical protein
VGVLFLRELTEKRKKENREKGKLMAAARGREGRALGFAAPGGGD